MGDGRDLYTSTSRIKMFIVYRTDEGGEHALSLPKYKKQELYNFLTAKDDKLQLQ